MTDSDLLKAIWAETRERFNYPALNEPEMVKSLDHDTAQFDWHARKSSISESFISELESVGMPRAHGITACINHETGHYAFFPRELSNRLYLLAEADKWFGEKALPIYCWYSDAADEGATLASGAGGEELIDLRKAGIRLAERGNDKKSASLNRLLISMYANSFGWSIPSLTEEEQKRFEKLKRINYINRPLEDHVVGLYLFGKAMEDVIDKNSPVCESSGIGREGNGPTRQEIDGALSDILRKLGPRAYNKTKAYLTKVKKGFKDPFEETEGQSRLAGISQGSFQQNNDAIPLYDRWASTFGIYIAKRPMEGDATALFRSGLKEYEVGDPVQKMDVFGSRGFLCVPGITKVHMEEESLLPARDWKVPDALIGVDSSVSMDHPKKHNGAIQVLAAFILGRNYHANGCQVGGWNFSTDIVFSPPSRDMRVFKEIMCGYWGGGTVLNTEKLKEYMIKLHPSLQFSTEQDYKALMEGMSKQEQKQFMKKSLEVRTPEVRKKLERLDNIIITDGYIANGEQVLSHLQTLAEVTRNIVFITEKGGFKTWAETKVPNTYVYPAFAPEDLMRRTIGHTRSLTRAEQWMRH